MTDRIFRPDEMPQLVVEHALAAAETQARAELMDPDKDLADAPAAIRDQIRRRAVELALHDVTGQVARAKGRGKDMRRLQVNTERRLPDLRRRLQRAENLLGADARAEFQDAVRRLRLEIREAEHLANRAGQAAIEWGVWPGEVQRLAEELLERPAEVERRVRDRVARGQRV